MVLKDPKQNKMLIVQLPMPCQGDPVPDIKMDGFDMKLDTKNVFLKEAKRSMTNVRGGPDGM